MRVPVVGRGFDFALVERWGAIVHQINVQVGSIRQYLVLERQQAARNAVGALRHYLNMVVVNNQQFDDVFQHTEAYQRWRALQRVFAEFKDSTDPVTSFQMLNGMNVFDSVLGVILDMDAERAQVERRMAQALVEAPVIAQPESDERSSNA
jgi:hypothetical protein